MTTTLVLSSYDSKTNRTAVGLIPGDNDVTHKLWVPSESGLVEAPGKFYVIKWPFVGKLYKHTDGEWHYPQALGYGHHYFEVRYKINTSVGFDAEVVNPPPTLAGARMWPAETLLPFLWDAGFRTEEQLLGGLSIAVGESGLYTQARNWLPSQGFRPATDVIGVEGPEEAWNDSHTQQGSSDRGLFQVNWQYHSQYSDAQCDDPASACQILFEMTGGGTDWRAWGFGAGISYYSQYWDQSIHGYPALRPLVQAFLATQA